MVPVRVPWKEKWLISELYLIISHKYINYLMLIYFDSSVYFSDKHISCIEAYGTSQDPEGYHHEQCVTKVQ